MGVRFVEAQTGFRVSDLDRSLDFYQRLDFQPTYRNADVHLVIQRDAVFLHLSTIEGKANTGCQIIVQNVDRLYEQVQRQALPILYQIGDRDWGNRDFTIADPDSNEITFSEPLKQVIEPIGGVEVDVQPGRYRHYKGADYIVIGGARHSETEEELVVYRPDYGARALWVRPKAMFKETVLVEDRPVPRFRFVGPE